MIVSSRALRHALASLAFAAAILAAPAEAAHQVGGRGHVVGVVPVDGGFMLAWWGTRDFPGSPPRLLLRPLDPSGRPLGPSVPVDFGLDTPLYGGFHDGLTGAALASDGRVALLACAVWLFDTMPAPRSITWAAPVGADGSLGATQPVNDGSYEVDLEPRSDGTFLVATRGHEGFETRVVDAAGVPLDLPQTIVGRHDPSEVTLPGETWPVGTFGLALASHDQDVLATWMLGQDLDLGLEQFVGPFSRRVSEVGGSTFFVSKRRGGGPNSEARPDMVAVPGGYLVGWAPSGDVWTRLLDLDGRPLSPRNRVREAPMTQSLGLAATPAGLIFAAWGRSVGDGSRRIEGRWLDATGQPLGPVIAIRRSGKPVLPRLTAAADGSVVLVVWSAQSPDHRFSRILARRIAPPEG